MIVTVWVNEPVSPRLDAVGFVSSKLKLSADWNGSLGMLRTTWMAAVGMVSLPRRMPNQLRVTNVEDFSSHASCTEQSPKDGASKRSFASSLPWARLSSLDTAVDTSEVLALTR
ncbi:hypothetical protein D9M68_824450 [compost metagenome]